MTKEEKLLSLLPPKSYVSKIKLYCPFSEFKVNKYSNILAQLENKSYTCKVIKIEEL